LEKQRRPLIELRDITKTFPGVKALSNVSFDIYPGEFHALCGENGAGKSTLIKVMTGAHQPDSGKIIVDGEEVHFTSPQQAIEKGIACIYQELTIAPQLDVAKNMFLGNMFFDKFGTLDLKRLYKDTKEILTDYIGLKVSPKTLAGELSVGQQQMIEIGRALTRHARVIIMDEPTSSLSEAETETLFKLIKMLKDDNVAIVYISHKLDEVMQLADRITVIRDGQNIITMNTSDTTQEKLISHMIGRELENLYQKSPAQQGDVVLEVKNLTSKGVFEDISFNVKAGEIVGFFGLVGAGRSEIMRAIFGVDKYDSGEVYICGKKLPPGNPTAAIESGLGFATEDRKKEGLMLRLSVLLNMSLVKLPHISKLGVINAAKQRELVDQYIKSISIKTPNVEQLVGNLSGGNQQKVVVAKWLMMSPKVLIVDEPTRGIDVGSKSEIYGLLNDLAHQGVAIIVVSSEIEEIMGICDRVITICEGNLTASLDIKNLKSETVLAAALGKTDIIRSAEGAEL
jgi:ABC-type sugar transport system ATPase subunit